MADGTEGRAECKSCGAPLAPTHAGPCPSCGELAGKKAYVTASVTARGNASASATVFRRWQERYEVLLDTAHQLRDHGHYEAAIVTAQTACEVCTEAVLTAALHERVGDDGVTDLITASMGNYNPTNHRVQEWYETLFDHRIQEESFWPSLKKHVARRHGVVHRGEPATSREADESIAAVDEAIRHLLKNRP